MKQKTFAAIFCVACYTPKFFMNKSISFGKAKINIKFMKFNFKL